MFWQRQVLHVSACHILYWLLGSIHVIAYNLGMRGPGSCRGLRAYLSLGRWQVTLMPWLQMLLAVRSDIQNLNSVRFSAVILIVTQLNNYLDLFWVSSMTTSKISASIRFLVVTLIMTWLNNYFDLFWVSSMTFHEKCVSVSFSHVMSSKAYRSLFCC